MTGNRELFVTASEFLSLFNVADGHGLIDVRSEGEFNKGHLPGSVNVPILMDNHRHLVGLCHKNMGQVEAIQLGHALVDPLREHLTQQWTEVAQESRVFVYCWRGGLRSSMACEWMREVGKTPTLIQGGYKSVRKQLLSLFEAPYDFLLLTGLTGSGKTKLLKVWPPEYSIDLENLAHHRGSAFGAHKDGASSQQTFENALGFELHHRASEFILEDESRSIGPSKLPLGLFKQMQEQPVVVLDCALEDRVEFIYKDYIESDDRTSKDLKFAMEENLKKISQRLGGLRFKDILEVMTTAFDTSSKHHHLTWISMLLEYYYDPLYTHRLREIEDRIVFRGQKEEVHEFICHRFSRSGTRQHTMS